MRKNQRKQPVYTEGKPCRKCGTTKKLGIWRIRPNSNERYRTARCHACYQKSYRNGNIKKCLERLISALLIAEREQRKYQRLSE